MKADFHLHTEFSPDSRIQQSELIPHAIKLGYDTLAITEHLDLAPHEITIYGLPSQTRYQANLLHLRQLYPQIRIIFGIEVGDYHLMQQYAHSIVSMMQYELILGSVHFLSNHTNISIPFSPWLTPAQITDYYEQNLCLIETCDIDVLAHLGVYKRYYPAKPDESHCLSLIDKILSTLISRDIALEINFSSYRKNYESLLPEPEYLLRYRSLGGKLVTIGSDSHRLEHFDDYHHIAMQTLSELNLELYTV
jgi:histidinol-phosphatase (PHP family)